MANPLTFLLPLRYDAVSTVLLVQSGPIDLASTATARLRTLFPGCEIELAVREGDVDAAEACGADRLTVVRWPDRVELLRRLRRRRYDVVAALLSTQRSHYVGLLPYLLRTRSILLFNDHLDYFPLKATRLPALAYHLSGGASARAALPWLLGRAIILPLAALFLVASTARLYGRAWIRGWQR
jgi:hypothetical protein